jgi:hypothetical protein
VVSEWSVRRERRYVQRRLRRPAGTFVDADGTCADARQTPACDGVRPDGLDLTAELLSAIR